MTGLVTQIKQAVVIAPPPHERTAAALAGVLSLRFALNPSEGRVLSLLLRTEVAGREELRAAASPHSTCKSLRVTMSMLRKKLEPHGIEITVLYKQGYALDRRARDKIYECLAEHGVTFVRTTPQAGYELKE
jgi:hypothetical protein